MPSFRIENYRLQQLSLSAFAEGTRTRIALYDDSGNYVIRAGFRKGNPLPPNSSHNGIYYLYFAWDEYLPLVDMLRNEKPIYALVSDSLDWGMIYTGSEPIGEEEVDELLD